MRDRDLQQRLDDELDRLAALPANWDAEGAPPIDPEIIQTARSLVRRFPASLTSAPAVVPMPKGNLQFEWHDGPRTLELEIETRETIQYLKWHPEEGIQEEDVISISDLRRVEDLLRWFHGSPAHV